MNDGYDHLREQVKKLCEAAVMKIQPGKNGFFPPAQPTTLAWIIVPETFYSLLSELEEVPALEIPSSAFAIMTSEIRLNSPEGLADLIEARFKGALLDIWELAAQDLVRRNRARRDAYYEKQS